MKNTKNANKAVYLTLGLLLIAVSVLAALNRGDAGLKRALEENREFLILTDGEPAVTVGLSDLLDLQPREFSAVMSSSMTSPREVIFKGVELRLILAGLDIDAADAAYIVVTGLDGYVTPLTPEEVYKPENVFMCFETDGEIMKTLGEGGFGPFMLVLPNERFAQRWCKYAETVDIRFK
ncbi:MAG: hypothetical protein FWG32_00105 [Oscillospiraceae bacterium]|nr:hypothetical protein [Oscillospiraceae bacterium]